jgi:hypothetical protein
MSATTKPRVLVVYYTYQEQARAFANVLADGLDASRSERESPPAPTAASAIQAGMGG